MEWSGVGEQERLRFGHPSGCQPVHGHRGPEDHGPSFRSSAPASGLALPSHSPQHEQRGPVAKGAAARGGECGEAPSSDSHRLCSVQKPAWLGHF